MCFSFFVLQETEEIPAGRMFLETFWMKEREDGIYLFGRRLAMKEFY